MNQQPHIYQSSVLLTVLHPRHPPKPPAWAPYFKMQVVRLKFEITFSSEFIRKRVVFSYCDMWYMYRGLRQLSLLFPSISP